MESFVIMRTSSTNRRCKILIVLETFNTSELSFYLSGLEEQAQGFHSQNEKQWGEGAALSQTPANAKEISGFAIDQDNKICTSHTTHDPFNHRMAKACLNQDHSEKVPIDTIKSFLEIKFENKCLGFFLLILCKHSWAVPIASRI
jgi:hypothetical protein